MQNLYLVELRICFYLAALCGVILWFYYNKIKNTHIRDDQLSERGCALFSLLMFLVYCILQLSMEFSLLNVAVTLACIVQICNEIFSKIPKAARIEKAKENQEPLYMACGFVRKPPNYDIERR